MANFINLLQEKCQANRSDLPTYVDLTDVPNADLRCECQLYHWRTVGTGTSKKLAKKNAAELMLKIVEKEQQFMTLKKNTALTSRGENVDSVHVMMKINTFASKNGKQRPLLAEKGVVNGEFVVEYTFDGYVAVGKGNSLKIAKKEALENIANHFNIHAAYEDYKYRKERILKGKNGIQKLLEVCQRRKLDTPSYKDKEERNLGKQVNFVVSCSLNNLMTTSRPNFSKKNAKIEAAEMMIEKLKETNTPERSPVKSPDTNNCENAKIEAAEMMIEKLKETNTPERSPVKSPDTNNCDLLCTDDEAGSVVTNNTEPYDSEAYPSGDEENHDSDQSQGPWNYSEFEESDRDQPLSDYSEHDSVLSEFDLSPDNYEPVAKKPKV